MAKNTLVTGIERGWVPVVHHMPGHRGRMICWADSEELERLRKLQELRHGWWDPPLRLELTTPQAAPERLTLMLFDARMVFAAEQHAYSRQTRQSRTESF